MDSAQLMSWGNWYAYYKPLYWVGALLVPSYKDNISEYGTKHQ